MWWPAMYGQAVYDDVLTLERDPSMRNLALGDLIGKPFFRAHLGYWRPLSSLTLASAYQGGMSMVHLMAIAAHTGAAITIRSIVATSLAAPPLTATACAALFLLHPVQVEAVAWASAAPEVLAGLLALLALRSALSPRASHAWLALSLTGALFAKESALAIVPALLLADAWARGRMSQQRPGAKLWITLAAAVAVWAAARYAVVGSVVWNQNVPGVATLLLGGAEVWINQLLLVLWPTDLTPFRCCPTTASDAGWAWLLLALIALVAAAVVCRRFRQARWQLALALCPAAVPAIVWWTLGEFCVQDRYSYLCVGGVCCLLGWGLRTQRWAWTVLAAALALGVATQRQCLVWRDQGHLVAHALQMAPHLATVQAMAGDHFLEQARMGGQGALPRARKHYEQALTSSFPAAPSLQRERRAAIWSGLGWVTLLDASTQMPRDIDLVTALFRKAIAAHDQVASGWVGLGVANAMAGRHEAAARALRTAISVDATSPEAWYNLGYLQWTMGQAAEARGSLRKALHYNPDFTEARQMLVEIRGR